MLKSSVFILILFCGFCLESCLSTLTPPKRGGKGIKSVKTKEVKIITGPDEKSVFDKNLVEEEPFAEEILIHNAAYYKDTSIKNFNGTVLGYVTPWNNHGYDVAKTFGPKFDMISPVWLQVIRLGELNYTLMGTHDIDQAWIKNVRKSGKNEQTKVLPRVMFDKFENTDYTSLLSQKDEREIVADLIIKACKKYKFDGIVLEFWQSLAKRIEDSFLYNLVLDIAKPMKKNGLDLILVIPPMRDHMQDLFSADNFNELYPHVLAFSLMTYDFSSIERPGANAPLHWVRSSIENICPKKNHRRAKILVGLNFYGYDFTTEGGGSLTGNDYLRLLKEYSGRLIHDDHDKENFFELKSKDTGRHFVFYPSLYSINERLKLAERMGTGISIWEIGQGLDFFYDLF